MSRTRKEDPRRLGFSLTEISVPLLVITIALIFIACGLHRGEAGEVLNKAARVCLECMGLGR